MSADLKDAWDSGTPVTEDQWDAAKPIAPQPVVPGNIDTTDLPYLRNADGSRRPTVINPDGSFSSTYSMSFGTDQGEVLVPTVIDGRRASADEAFARYKQTGEHLGIFKNAQDADVYGQDLHNRQEQALLAMQAAQVQQTDNNDFLAKAFQDAFAGTPDKHAQILRLAEETGAPADTVERNFDAIQSSWQTGKLNVQAWRQANPHLSEILLQRPELGPVILRDEKVGKLTNALRAASGIGEAAGAAFGAALPTLSDEQKAKLPWYDRWLLNVASWGMPTSGQVGVTAGLTKTARATGDLPPEQVATVNDATALEAQGLTGLSRAKVPYLVYQDARAQARANSIATEWAFTRLRGGDGWDAAKRLTDSESSIVPRYYGEGGAVESLASDAATLLGSQVESLEGTGAGAAALAVPTLAVTRSPALAGETAVLGGKAGATLVSFTQEMGSAIRDFKKVRTDTGEPLSEPVLIGAAMAYGAAAAAVETASFGAETKALGPLGETIAAGGGKQQFLKLIKDPAFRRVAVGIFKARGEHMATEAAEEGVQQILEDMAGYTAKSVQAGAPQQTDILGSLESAGEQVRQTFRGEILSGPLMAGGTALGHAGIAKVIGAAAQTRSEGVAKAIGEVADGPASKASPSAVADLIERETAASGEAVTHVYLDPAKVQEVAPELSNPQAVQDAMASGGKLEVPVADYLGRWAPVVGDQLVDHMATRPGYMTAAEAKVAEPETQAQAEAIASEPVSDVPAIDAAVAQQVEAQGAQALPAEVMGLSGEQYQTYLDEQAKAKSTAARRVELAAKREQLREKDSWWKTQEADHREQAAKDFEKTDGRKAQQWLRGKVVEDDGTITPMQVPKLDRAAVREMVGDEAARTIPTAAKGGMHPDDMAGMLGFDSGKALLDAVATVPEKNEWVKQAASDRMLEKYPTVLEDRERLRRVVDQGLHGDESSRWLLKELAALKQKAGAEGRVSAEAIRRAAGLMVARQTVGTLNASVALTRERGAANRKALSAAKGEWGRAYVYAQQQLLNMHLWRELDHARDEREAFLSRASNLASPNALARLNKASPVYADGVSSILESIGLKEPQRRDQPATTPDALAAQVAADGGTVMYDPTAIGRLVGRGIDWRDMTLDEMREVNKALGNAQKTASAKVTSLVEGKRADQDEIAAKLVAEADKLKQYDELSSSPEAEGLAERAIGGLANIDGSLLKEETMLNWLGGKSIASTWFRAILLPLQEGKHEEVDLLRKVFKPVIDAFDAIPGKVRRHLTDRVDGKALFPNHKVSGDLQIAPPTRRFEVIMMVLHSGSESSLSRLTEGRNITVAEVERARSMLTKQELDWVQSIWDASESLKPLAFALEERASGARPEQIVARPFTTEHGNYRGGYFPAVYDKRVEPAGERQAARSVSDLNDPTFPRPFTSHGYLKSRVEGFSGALSLSPRAIQNHLAQMAHDIAFRERIQSVGSLLLRPDVQGALKRTLGLQRSKQLLQWAKDIGSMRGAQAGTHAEGLNKLVMWMRGNMGGALLKWKPQIAVGDAGNLGVAISGTPLKSRHLAAGLAEMTASPVDASRKAFEESGELRFRQDHIVREFARQVKDVTRSLQTIRAPLDWFNEHGFAFLEWSEKGTSVPIWIGAKRQALEEGASNRDAVIFADSVIRQVFPSHSAVDTPAIMRDKGFWGVSTIFYGYSNTLYNIQRDALEPLRQAQGVGTGLRAAASVAGTVAMRLPAVTGRLMALYISGNVLQELLMGRGADPDESWAAWFTRKLLSAPLQTTPIAEPATMLESFARGREPNPKLTPISNWFDTIGKAGMELAKGSSGDSEKQILAAGRALGLTFGIPIAPLTQGQYLFDLANGTADPKDPFDLASGFVYGHRENQPANPLSLMSDLVSGGQ